MSVTKMSDWFYCCAGYFCYCLIEATERLLIDVEILETTIAASN